MQEIIHMRLILILRWGRLCLPRTEVFLQAAMLKTLLILLAAVQKEQRFFKAVSEGKNQFSQLPLPEQK